MRNLTLCFLYNFLCKNVLKYLVGVRFDNARFLLNEKQFIIVANHNSHLDTATLMSSMPAKIIHKVKPVAAGDYFGKTKWRARFSNFFVNTLLIPRKRDKENPENDPINKMVKALDDGYSLILFPEGTRGEPEKEQPLKPGVALVLLQRPNVCFVPAYMKGMGKALPKGERLLLPYNSFLIYGRPTKIIDNTVDEILAQIEKEFSALKAQVN